MLATNPTPIRRIACVDVGSGALNLLIAEQAEQQIKILDRLHKSIPLGRDCYSLGEIRLRYVKGNQPHTQPFLCPA